jgi:hypothetical protein
VCPPQADFLTLRFFSEPTGHYKNNIFNRVAKENMCHSMLIKNINNTGIAPRRMFDMVRGKIQNFFE